MDLGAYEHRSDTDGVQLHSCATRPGPSSETLAPKPMVKQ